MTERPASKNLLASFSREELIVIAGEWLEKAQLKNREARFYRNKCERLEAELLSIRPRG
ncbi:hypothetical protein ACX80I_12635 [Arthrobacter sp. MDT3-44]